MSEPNRPLPLADVKAAAAAVGLSADTPLHVTVPGFTCIAVLPTLDVEQPDYMTVCGLVSCTQCKTLCWLSPAVMSAILATEIAPWCAACTLRYLAELAKSLEGEPDASTPQ